MEGGRVGGVEGWGRGQTGVGNNTAGDGDGILTFLLNEAAAPVLVTQTSILGSNRCYLYVFPPGVCR